MDTIEGGPANGGHEVDLFTPVKLGRYELANRLVMAPMTRNRAAGGDVPQAINVEYYGQRASAGLIVTEGSQISPQGKGYPRTPGIYSQDQIEGWQAVTGAVHDGGGRIFLQLWHVGRISHPSLQPDGALPVAPSALRPDGEGMTHEGPKPFVTPRALETNEIAGLVETYRKGAANALEAGFDGVEIHAANGYLIDQFLRDGTNRRSDSYGGSLENRARLLVEVTQAVTGVLGGERVGVRFSPVNPFNSMSDSNPGETFGYAAGALNRFGLAYLHVVEGGMGGDVPDYDLAALRQAFTGTYIANNGYDKERASAALSSGAADLIAFGKPFLANPDLPARLAASGPLNKPNAATFYGGDTKGYTDYPALAPVGAG